MVRVMSDRKRVLSMNKNKTSIIFTGDIGFDRFMDKRWEDDNLLSKEVLDFFHSADHVVANVEGAVISAEEAGVQGEFIHNMDPAATRVFRNMQADIWAIGNNHIMDVGPAGMVSTRRIAGEMGCQTIGAGLNEEEASQPVWLDDAGGIGMINVTHTRRCQATATEPGVLHWGNWVCIKERIDEIKEKCRWCVVVCHGGEEFTSLPSPYTRDRYMKFLEMGADVVVGHHPHVTENYELFDDGKAIFYSLGNFIFDTNYQRAHLYTDLGVLLKLIFTEDKLDFEAMGIRIVRGDERIEKAPLPDVFTNIPAEEYELLAPLAAKAFVMEEKRRMIYLEPDRFANATPEQWESYFLSDEPEGYVEGAHMDFNIMLPYSKTADEIKWKQSKLETVRDYILRQL